MRKSGMRISVVRFQVKSPLVFSFGIAPAPLCLIYVSQQDMRVHKLRIQFQCLSGCGDYFWPYFTWRSADKNRAELVIRIRKADVGWCKHRVLPYRFLKVTNTLLKA